MVKRLAVLGATGSIGQSTLDLVAHHPDRFAVSVLTAHRQVEPMATLCERFTPRLVVMSDREAAAQLRQALTGKSWATRIVVADGAAALSECVDRDDVDMVVAGIVGAAGLSAAIRAARAGKTILLANKEALVMAGALMVNAAKIGGATILPIDSEHNAIFQCLGENYRCFTRPAGVTRLLLTASGGPFRTWDKDRIYAATVHEAIHHPNWSMGRKISVDSATMMNKGLELIEAHWLFAMPESEIDVVIHPQSVVHSMVEFEDGSTLAQMGAPDMRTPIACAMSWPERMHTPVHRLDWRSARQLDFEPPDHNRFPSLELARASLRTAGSASAVMNAANEVAVEAFLNERLRFGQIFQVVEHTLNRLARGGAAVPDSVESLLSVDHEARRIASQQCGAIAA